MSRHITLMWRWLYLTFFFRYSVGTYLPTYTNKGISTDLKKHTYLSTDETFELQLALRCAQKVSGFDRDVVKFTLSWDYFRVNWIRDPKSGVRCRGFTQVIVLKISNYLVGRFIKLRGMSSIGSREKKILQIFRYFPKYTFFFCSGFLLFSKVLRFKKCVLIHWYIKWVTYY